MRRSRTKRHMDRGASVVIALIVFAVAAIVSTTVVTAALTAHSGTRAVREDEREFLSVTSAAAVLREALENDSVRITQTEADGVVTNEYDYLPAEEDNALSGLVKTLVREAWEGGAGDPYGRLTLTLDGYEDMDVDVWLTLRPEEQKLEALLAPANPAVSAPDADAYSDCSVLLVFTNVGPRQAGEPVTEDRDDGIRATVTRYELLLLPENCHAQGGAQ